MEHRSHCDDGARACDESASTGEVRWRDTPRQREAQAHECDEVQWTKHASRSESQTQQHVLTSRGGVLEERVYARCPQHMSTTTYIMQPPGLALCSRCHPAWASEGTPVGPGKDTHGTLGPGQRGGRGWPDTNATNGEVKMQ